MNNATDSVEVYGGRLVQALNSIMDVNETREKRVAANAFLDEFKNTSPICAQCGLYLASNCDVQPMVRHFGLLLVEHSIKYEWNKLALDQKIFIKNAIMDLLAKGTNDLLHEQYYIKNAFAKNVVEIVKREWPQQWPSMLEEIYLISELGHSQKELVLLVFLRLAEDVVTLQNLQGKRRREIHQGLTSNMTDLFAFFTDSLVKHTEAYYKTKSSFTDHDQHLSRIHGQMVAATLATLAEYVDWVPVCYLVANEGVLLRMLCVLLADRQLKLAACECLLTIAGRKGNMEDRKLILVALFCSESMLSIFREIRLVWGDAIEEHNYNFLKRICLVLATVGNLLCYVWVFEDFCNGCAVDIEWPSRFATYLEVMLEFLVHPSQVLCGHSVLFWVAAIRHEHISRNKSFLSILGKVVEGLASKLIKVGLPSRNDSPNCVFSRLDFDSDEDFCASFSKIRTSCTDALRLATGLAPHLTFNCVASWLSGQLRKPIDISSENTEMCTPSSPSYLEWDALALCLESVLWKQNFVDKSHQLPMEDGIQLLERVLRYKTEDPLILSTVLSCISALTVFLMPAPHFLSPVLDKIFSAVVFSLPGQSKATRSRAVKNVRRHACSCLVKICKNYPDLLLPSSTQIYEHIRSLTGDPEQLSQMEKCTLVECLILISNHYVDFERQSLFLSEILTPITALWVTVDIQKALSSVEAFMAYIGLDKPPVEPSSSDLSGINRSQIIGCINVTLAVIKRSTWPTDLDIARKGGFVRNIPRCGTPVLCNPAAKFITPLIHSICLLLRMLMLLWIPEVSARISPEYAKANDILTSEKNNVLGIPFFCNDALDLPPRKQPIERMQNFLTTVYDVCFHILGSAGSSLGHEFYCHSEIVHCVTSFVFPHLGCIPDYRLRPVVRHFMKAYVLYCPPELYQAALIPLLTALCPYMQQRLSQKWAAFDQRTETKWETSACGNEDNADVQEILDDQLHRQLTREYVDLLVIVMQGKKGSAMPDGGGDVMEDDLVSAPQNEGLGELGQLVMRTTDLFPSVILTLFSALAWNDTTASARASYSCLPSVKQLVVDQILGESEALHIFTSILMGLQQHGQHEGNASLLFILALHSYEILRPLYPSLVNVLLQIPNCSANYVQRFDDMLLSATQSKQLPEKRKKDMFRGLISGAIGQNVGAMFRKEVRIKNLPPLFQPSRNLQRGLLDEQGIGDVGLCNLFACGDGTSVTDSTHC